ncbi:unnamed protein product [Coregonus sp. 'balchen']|nr:unnamed protein product [Coregonus sp. 'balchen']
MEVEEEVEEVLEQDQLREAGVAGALMERPEVGERLDHQRRGSVGGTSDSHSRSSSITSCESVQGMMLSTTTMEQSELSSSRYWQRAGWATQGPGCGILNLVVTDPYVWCLDFKGGLHCSTLPDGGPELAEV